MPLMMPKIVSAHDAVADDSPNTTEPTTSGVLSSMKAHGSGIRGVRFYLDFTAANTCDVTVWAKNEHGDAGAATAWVNCGTLVGVAPLVMCEHTQILASKVFLQLTNIAGNPVDVFAEMLTD